MHVDAHEIADESIEGRMTIDELARLTDLTTRTIRSYQDRGLLPPPEIIGRTGYYDEEHLRRLNVIGRMLDQRFSLASIGALFMAWERGQSLADILGFVEELTTPYSDEQPHRVTVDDLEEVFPAGHPDLLQRAVDIGVLLPDGDAYDVPSPRLLDGAAKLIEAGVPLERLVREGEKLKQDCDRIASRFNEIFMEYVWVPYMAAGRPEKDFHKVAEYLAIMRPLPVEITSAMIARAMREQLEDSILDMLDPAGEARPEAS